MRTLFFGGSFDPIHHGHLIMAVSARESIGARRLVLIPCGDAPHKKLILPHAYRVRLCELATQGSSFIEVSDIEGKLPGKSYTYNTIQALKSEYATIGKPSWLIGGDTVAQLPTWHRIEELVNEVEFVITERPGHVIPWESLPAYLQPLRANMVSVPLLNISSTEIRERAAAKKTLQFFVPNAVWAQIHNIGLYLPVSDVSSGG